MVKVYAIIFSVCICLLSYSQDDSHVLKTFKVPRFKLEGGSEYYWRPIEESRQIQTAIINILIGKQFFKKVHLSVMSGITANYAWGNIMQYNDFFEDVKYENAAFGIGPVFMLRFEPLVVKGFSLGIDGSGAVIFYTEDFPAGGDFYNFMWRMGPTLTYQINDNLAINIGYRWMHVSNGQGLTPKNPSYEGEGVCANLVKNF